jgi:rhodanese-related sulfurtransferase
MTVKPRVGIRELIEEAKREIQAIPAAEAIRLLDDDDVVFVDLREVQELEREGRVPGALNMPRGVAEFWIDPQSPYHKEIFSEDKRFAFYCARDWRSALATRTAQELGLERVCHVEGGFAAWVDAGGPVEPYRRRS